MRATPTTAAPRPGPPPDTVAAPARRASRRRLPASVSAVVGVASLIVAVPLLARAADPDALASAARAMLARPGGVVVALLAFGAAFALRAGLWSRVLPDLAFTQALAALHVTLGANHVLPLRLGEPMRVLSVVRRTTLGFEAVAASSILLRSWDIVAMALLGWILAPAAFGSLLGPWGALILSAVLGAGVLATVWLRRRKVVGLDRIRLPGPVVAAGSMLAWVLEAVLVWQCAHFAGIDLSFHHAVLVTTAAVTAQTVAIAPGGIGTYEAASVVAYASLGHDPTMALTAALTAHSLKTLYSFVAGGVALYTPSPALIGRLRLPRRGRAAQDGRGHRERASIAVPPLAASSLATDPVVLFLPAHDEEATVAAVVRRCPARVGAHPVVVLVIDDGSRDATAARAAEAGATVVSLPHNVGLGAAVRAGLHEAVARHAVAAVFCDADGEYAPEDLGAMVEPILTGRADYVVGSRFRGEIRSMHLHRRLGNVVLTTLLSIVARRRLSDGQSGYRALSLAAARDAEIVHDFNYAQVLTLDLLAKGHRYAEVPISYGFRTEGESFVRLGRYLRHVVPAVYREVNDLARV